MTSALDTMMRLAAGEHPGEAESAALHAVLQLKTAEQRLVRRGKENAGLVARAALAGVALHLTEDDAGRPLFIASKWAMCRQLHSVDEVQGFLRRIGAPPA